MTPKRDFNNYTVFVAITALLAMIVYGYFSYNHTIDELRAKLANFDSSQEQTEAEFVKINDDYNNMMASMSEKDQMLIKSQSDLKEVNEQLVAVLHKQEKTADDLAQAKALIEKLKSQLEYANKMGNINDEIIALKAKNLESEQEIQRYRELLNQREGVLSNYKADVVNKQTIIQKGNTLRLMNFDIKGIKVRANGTELETDQAKKADKLRVSFNINENGNIADNGPKTLYLALYDSNNKLAKFPSAHSGTLKLLNGSYTDYTDFIRINYVKGTNQPIEFDWENNNFQKGDYKIKVYQNGQLIGSEIKSFR